MVLYDGQKKDVKHVNGIFNKLLVFCIIRGLNCMFTVHSNRKYSSEATYQVMAALLFYSQYNYECKCTQ